MFSSKYISFIFVHLFADEKPRFPKRSSRFLNRQSQNIKFGKDNRSFEAMSVEKEMKQWNFNIQLNSTIDSMCENHRVVRNLHFCFVSLSIMNHELSTKVILLSHYSFDVGS